MNESFLCFLWRNLDGFHRVVLVVTILQVLAFAKLLPLVDSFTIWGMLS